MNAGTRRRIGAVLTLTVAFLAPGRTLHAQTEGGVAPTAREAPRDLVVVRILSDEAEGAPFESSLRELLGRLGIRIESARGEVRGPESAATPSTLAVVWVDLKAPTRATATIAEGRSNRIVVSREVARDRSPAIVGDEIAHIVYGAVEELAQSERDRTNGRKETPAPPPPAPSSAPLPTAPAPAPDKSARRHPGLDGGAFAAGRALGSDANLAVGGGALVGFAFVREGVAPAIWLSGAYHAPVDAKGQLVDAHLSLLTARLAPTVALAHGDRWRFELGPEGGVDVAWTSTTSDALPRSRLADDRTTVSPMLGILAMARFAVAPTADVFLAAMIDADLAPDRYVVRQGPRADIVFETWPVRPALAFGFTFAVAGPPLYVQQEPAR